MNKVYLFFLFSMEFTSLSKSLPQEIDIRRIGGAFSRMLGKLELADISAACSDDTVCRPSQKCILNHCRNPCNTECGVNAVCSVVNHEPICKCPKCYDGDALIKCTSYEGSKQWNCLWNKLIRSLNLKVAYTPEEVDDE